MNHDARLDPRHVTGSGVLHGIVHDDSKTPEGWNLNAGPIVFGRPKPGATVKCASGRRFLLGGQYVGSLVNSLFGAPYSVARVGQAAQITNDSVDSV